MLIKQTPQQRANTLYALNEMWPSIPKTKVARDLGDWVDESGGEMFPEAGAEIECGSPACFGGWCARMPFFKEQGVRFDLYNRPTLITADGIYHTGLDSAEGLFGDWCLFHTAGDHPSDPDEDGEPEEGFEHELVMDRLRWLLANSEVVT